MLGKLFVSSTSTPEKLQAAHELLTDAIEDRSATDAPSRNATNRLLVALTKAIGASGAATSTTAPTTVAKDRTDDGQGNRTVCEDDGVGTNAGEGEEGEKMEGVEQGESEGIEGRESIPDETKVEAEL